jgi:hypothetical protein
MQEASNNRKVSIGTMFCLYGKQRAAKALYTRAKQDWIAQTKSVTLDNSVDQLV